MRQKKYNASLERNVQLQHVGPGADSPAHRDVIHISGIPGWNLLWDMSVAPCAWLAGSHGRAVPPGNSEQTDRASGNKALTRVLQRVTEMDDWTFSKISLASEPLKSGLPSALVII